MNNIKEEITLKLKSFLEGSLFDACSGLLNLLGIKFSRETAEPINIIDLYDNLPKQIEDIVANIKKTYYIGEITEDTVCGKKSDTTFADDIKSIDEGKYKSIMIFAIEMKGSAKVTRTEIASLTRSLNHIAVAQPIVLFLKYETKLALSICERTDYKQTWRMGEKMGKVSILRDIDCFHPHRGHIDILSSLEVSKCKTFDDIYKYWQDVFSSILLTKTFYKELQNWYFWAIKNVSFPNDIDDDTDDQKYNKENVIRLITRLIFVWFIKHKDLVPSKLFDEEYLRSILNDFEPIGNDTQYYRAILQNLFFATLNQEIDKRDFAIDNNNYAKNRSTYNIKNLYRYENEFTISIIDVLEIFRSVPFMNGGLFECLDGKKKNGKTYYWDGYSRRKERQAVVPNYLFFEKDRVIDLSEEYNNSKMLEVHVSGIINIFKKYTFTIEENTPLDEDVALDPELLGRVFENLIGIFNPETHNNARNETGSFYTPRKIVNFMVDESLVAYLHSSVPSVNEIDVRDITSYNDKIPTTINEEQKKALIKAIYNCKVLDPACGSGAFQMGMLQQMSHILSKLDEKNLVWQDVVTNQTIKDAYDTNDIDKDQEQSMLEDIKWVFKMAINYPNYARKLYIIENCIYGVDIQSIAVQITRLRFFISLICEQEPTTDPKTNYGIRPLPNLESKFVAANTLIALEENDEDEKLFKENNITDLINKLKEVRHRIFSVTRRTDKLKLFEKDEKIRQAILMEVKNIYIRRTDEKISRINEGIKQFRQQFNAIENEPDKWVETVSTNIFGEKESVQRYNVTEHKRKTIEKKIKDNENEIDKLRDNTKLNKVVNLAKKLTEWNPYDQNSTSPFFDPKWMFNITENFDIVIGNPPFIQLQDNGGKLGKQYKDCGYSTFARTGDIYCLFYERGWQFLKDGGYLCLITSNKWMRAGYGEKTRQFLASKTDPILLLDFAGVRVFESATVDTNILLFSKGKNNQKTICTITNKQDEGCIRNLSVYVQQQHSICSFSNSENWVILSPIEQSIKRKIEAVGTPLKDWDVQINYGIKTGYNEAFIISTDKRTEILANCKTEDERQRTDEIIRPILRGRDIKRYGYNWANLWLIWIPWHFPLYLDKSIVGASIKAEKEFERQYPAVYRYLLQYKPQLSERNKAETGIRYEWYALQRWGANYMDDFNKPKICWKAIGRKLAFALVDSGTFLTAPASFISAEKYNELILAYLCSTLGKYFIYKNSDRTGAGDIMLNIQSLIKFPIAQKKFQQLMNIIKSHDDELIDRAIFATYGFTEEEVAYIYLQTT